MIKITAGAIKTVHNRNSIPMKKLLYLFFALLLTLPATGCGSSKNADGGNAGLQEKMDERNSAVIPLITRIRRLPGMTVENGVPVFVKAQNTAQSGQSNEPLYVLDGQVIGNSFRRVRDVVNTVDVKSIKPISGAEASFYGSQGANGVILITTKQGG